MSVLNDTHGVVVIRKFGGEHSTSPFINEGELFELFSLFNEKYRIEKLGQVEKIISADTQKIKDFISSAPSQKEKKVFWSGEVDTYFDIEVLPADIDATLYYKTLIEEQIKELS